MQTDITGLENVCKYIQATKYSKFTISKVVAGANGNNISVFDLIDSNSNEHAVETFRTWAEFMNNNLPYKIVCFDEIETIHDVNGVEKIKKIKSKVGKSSVTFCLNQNTHNAFASSSNGEKHENNNNFDLVELRKSIINEISEQREKNEILQEIRNLHSKFAKLEEEEEEEEEETNKGIAGIDANQLSQIMGLINMFKGTPTPPVLNGIEDENNFKDNINKAIKILYKHDKELDKDLLKLSELAETKPDTFKMLISTLRSM
jgi:hypothetical protein